MRKDRADKSTHPYDGSKDPDLALVALAKTGQASAISQLMHSYQKRVFSVCYRMVNNYEDAADLTQECLIRVFTHLDRFDGRSAFSTWVIRIAMNVSLSHLRKVRRRRETQISKNSAESGLSTSDNHQNDPPITGKMLNYREPEGQSSVEQNEETRLLEKCLEEIGDEYRALLILRDIQGLEYTHMAEVLGIPIGTVKSRLFRARLAFRKSYERHEKNNPTNDKQSKNHTDFKEQTIEVSQQGPL